MRYCIDIFLAKAGDVKKRHFQLVVTLHVLFIPYFHSKSVIILLHAAFLGFLGQSRHIKMNFRPRSSKITIFNFTWREFPELSLGKFWTSALYGHWNYNDKLVADIMDFLKLFMIEKPLI